MATSNLPVPAQMEMQGDLVNNWAFFHTQWEDYEIPTGLNEKSNKFRIATLRSIMGREWLRAFQNLEDRKKPVRCLAALETSQHKMKFMRDTFSTTVIKLRMKQ